MQRCLVAAVSLALSACEGSSTGADDPQLGFVITAEQTTARDVTGVCLGRRAQVDPETGLAQCTVTELSEAACGVGRTGTESPCVICQQGDGTVRERDASGRSVAGCAPSQATGDYWTYVAPEDSDECPTGGAIRFLGDSLPLPGAEVRIECTGDREHHAEEPSPSGTDAGP